MDDHYTLPLTPISRGQVWTTDRDRQTERQRDRETETERQRDRETERERERDREREREGERESKDKKPDFLLSSRPSRSSTASFVR